MHFKEAIVLAGGLGTRLQHVLPDIPKCMAPVKGKPFLAYVLNYLENQGINKVILSVGYRKEQIINYFGNIYNSISIKYSEENEPLGTGGAVKLALSKCTLDKVFIINGDTYFTPNLSDMENVSLHSSAEIVIAIKKMSEPERYGFVITNEEGRISEFREKQKDSGNGWINGGIYLINRNLMDGFQLQKFSIENDVFKLLCASLNIQSFKSDSYFLDIGIPEDYKRAQIEINSYNCG
jgi:D-glycero-alpha-D-manno-heptose 1-phosphate guanylyltransferase